MPRQALWKSTYLTSTWKLKTLESYWMSSKGAFPDKVFQVEDGFIETNLSWSDLRDIFSFAFVPFPREWVTDTMATWERFPEGENDD